MALITKGKHNHGDGFLDIQDELRDYSRQNGYLATQFANALCSCGSTAFRIQLDDDAGAAVRVCNACGVEQAIADSGDYLDEAELAECECPCGKNIFEASVGVALYAQSVDVKWLYLGLRCIHCGLVACYGDWKNEYIGYEELLRQV